MRILVLYGGNSPEREVSLTTGRAVREALSAGGHTVELCDPWAGSSSESSSSPGHALRELVDAVEKIRPEVIFVALHGGHGEDGTVQAALELLEVPYTGSGVLASSIAMDKVISKALFVRNEVPTPEWVVVDPSASDTGDAVRPADAAPVVADLGFPVVVKPVCGGSTVGTHIVGSEAQLPDAVADALRWDRRALVERYIPGRELTVAVLDGVAMPVVEIHPQGDFYDYEAKYTSGRSTYEVPASLPDPLAERLQDLSCRVFRMFGCAGVARVDFRLSPDEVPFCLEANVVPGLTSTSLVPKAAAAQGTDFPTLVEMLCRAALERRR